MITFIKKTFVILSIPALSFGLTKKQIKIINDSYEVSKKISYKGFNFAHTITGILGAESSFGVFVIGDKYTSTGMLKPLYLSSLGYFQIKLSTAKKMIGENPELLKKYGYLYNPDDVYGEYIKLTKRYKELVKFRHMNEKAFIEYKTDNNKFKKKMKYYESVLNNTIWIKRYKAKQPKAIKTMKWAKRNYLKYKRLNEIYIKKISKNAKSELKILKKELIQISKKRKMLKNKIHKDNLLINKLLNDYKFGAEIASYYLIHCYKLAKRFHFKNPYRQAVGRYNGGWNNMKYFERVKKKMFLAQKYLKK